MQLSDSQPAVDFAVEPYNALSSHIILVIDGALLGDSALLRAFERAAQQDSRYRQHALYLSTDNAAARSADTLRSWLRMDDPDAEDGRYEEMLRLRAVVIDWDRVADARQCCEEVRLAYPCLALFVVTEAGDAEVREFFSASRLGACPVIYSGVQRFEQAALSIGGDLDRAIDWRYDTPYWDSLRSYSVHPVVSFHALPLGQSRSLSKSLADFSAFYGNRLFTAETSLTTMPLDSLLTPRSTIEEAQAKAAYAFGAEMGLEENRGSYGTRFVTNGTSTANTVVISAFVRAGEQVLMERTCHISHFHALAYANARPVMLESFVNAYGCIGPAPQREIRAAFKNLLESHDELPTAIILTNPSFDGLFYRPGAAIETVRSVLREYWSEFHGSERYRRLFKWLVRHRLGDPAPTADQATEDDFLQLAFQRMVFLFDEAWSARAYFHPRLIEYTAMRGAWDLLRRDDFDYMGCLRVYATQSTHKSLSALRQGSMIHFRDPLMEQPEVRQLFEQAFRAHCTTSPSASIIASLDVARRQAQLEGALLIERCTRLAQGFRREFAPATGDGKRRSVYVLDEQQMMQSCDPARPDLSPDECFLDPTHVTLAWDAELSGGEVRRLLLHNAIQVNKYERSSVLAIFNIGIDDGSVRRLSAALTQVEERLENVRSSTPLKPRRTLPAFPGIHEGRGMGYWMQNQPGLPIRFYELESLLARMEEEPAVCYIAASFVTPYPPGFPLLVPGQVVSKADVQYLLEVPIQEIFGTQREDGRISIMLYRQEQPR